MTSATRPSGTTSASEEASPPSRRQLFALAAALAALTITGAVAIDALRARPAPAGPVVVEIVQTTPTPVPVRRAPVRREGGD